MHPKRCIYSRSKISQHVKDINLDSRKICKTCQQIFSHRSLNKSENFLTLIGTSTSSCSTNKQNLKSLDELLKKTWQSLIKAIKNIPKGLQIGICQSMTAVNLRNLSTCTSCWWSDRPCDTRDCSFKQWRRYLISIKASQNSTGASRPILYWWWLCIVLPKTTERGRCAG